MSFQTQLEELLATTRTVLNDDLISLQRMTPDRRRQLYSEIQEDKEKFKFEFEQEYREELKGAPDNAFRGKFAAAQLFLHVASIEDSQTEPLAPEKFTEDEVRAARKFDQYRAFDVSDREELERRIRNKDDELYEFIKGDVVSQIEERIDVLESNSNDIGQALIVYLKDEYKDRLDTAEEAVSIYIKDRGLHNVIHSIEDAIETTAKSSLTREDVREEIESSMESFSEQMAASLRDQERALRAELDSIATDIHSDDIDTRHLETKIDDLRSQINEFDHSRRQEVDELSSIIDQIQSQREKLDTQIQELEEKQREATKEAVDIAEGAVAEDAERLIEDELSRLQKQKATLNAEVNRLQREREQIDAASDRLEQDYDDLVTRVDDLETSVTPSEETEDIDAIPAEDARLFELDYIGRIESSLKEADSIPLPDGESFHLESNYWEGAGTLEIGDRRERLRELIDADAEIAQYPLGRFIRGELRTGGFFSSEEHLVIEAAVYSNLEAYATNGFDASPAGLENLLSVANRALDRADEYDTPHLIAIASPTGWTKHVIDHVENGTASRARFNDEVSICLVDLRDDELYYDPADDLLVKTHGLFERQVDAERIEKCKRFLQDEYVSNNAEEVLLKDIVSSHGCAPRVVKAAFEALAEAGHGRILSTKAGTVLDIKYGRR